MAVTNAISAVIIVGALIAVGAEGADLAKILGFIAVTLAAVNIFGGFTVTQRMLAMYKKKEAQGETVMSGTSQRCLSRCRRSVHSGAAGLSSPESSRRGNMIGMIGMVIAVATTLAAHGYLLHLDHRRHRIGGCHRRRSSHARSR